ncbi:cytochrome b [Vibrio aquaticus]|uniref:Cytochrome b n=1 Tax=Vibrio aquaticus TaxID=2496559 RepID=A0A3S0MNV7_9VIBR|nr:cytochrome b [Vibrio aquaticus]RTZ16144.1 cytochrome b [Vibrio aquaticus]
MSKSLSKQTILLHWLTGLTFIAVFALGYYLEGLPRSPEKGELLGIHKSLGIIVLTFAVARLAWRLFEGQLSSVAKLTKTQELGAKAIHLFLLVTTLAMPISGIAMSYGGGRAIEVFGIELLTAGEKIEWLANAGGAVHGLSVNLIIVALLLHVGAALKHQLIDKDGTLSRMFGK